MNHGILVCDLDSCLCGPGGGSRVRCRNTASVRCCAGTEWGYVLGIIVVGKKTGPGLGCGLGWAAQPQTDGQRGSRALHRILCPGQSRWELEECGQNRLEGQEQQGSPRFRNSDGLASAPARLTPPLPFLSPCHQLPSPLGVARAGL